MLGGRDEASETGVRSRKPVEVGGTGKFISASLDAVLRRRWDGSDLATTDGARITPWSSIAISSSSLLVSLLATFTTTSLSWVQRVGVIGDGKGDGLSVVVGDATLAGSAGDRGGKMSSGANTDGIGS
jgi:hypothetical protein